MKNESQKSLQMKCIIEEYEQETENEDFNRDELQVADKDHNNDDDGENSQGHLQSNSRCIQCSYIQLELEGRRFEEDSDIDELIKAVRVATKENYEKEYDDKEYDDEIKAERRRISYELEYFERVAGARSRDNSYDEKEEEGGTIEDESNVNELDEEEESDDYPLYRNDLMRDGNED